VNGTWRFVDAPAGALRYYATTASSATPGPAVVLCHELPRLEGGAAEVGRTFPALADRIAAESGWRVLTANLRGTGGSEGEFSAQGWLADLAFFVARELPQEEVFVVGFGLGGALALRLAATEHRVSGVATLGAPADLTGWVRRPQALLDLCRRSGVVHSPGFPDDLAAWAQELVDLQPLAAAGALSERPLLVVHGLDDPEVGPEDARALAEAAGGNGHVELRIVPGAGHWLRADPRVVATLVGWLERWR
jgi:pimeloyl-ACP methyl ester carboxylesterase